MVTANRELSPTLKLKRNLLNRNYNRVIDEIYAVSKSDYPVNNGIKLPHINLRVDLNELKRKLKW
jgi:hypothetical protein